MKTAVGTLMDNVLIFIVIIILTMLFVFGCYWGGKRISYIFFYKDMVENTIKEMVKPEALK